MAQIQFARGLNEEVIPDVKLTRSKSGAHGTATFYFQSPNAFNSETSGEITGMYMVDEEGELLTREVKGVFVNGQARDLQATYLMKSPEEWERFMRFMQRYAKDHGLELSQS